jgi:hypothetical protein
MLVFKQNKYLNKIMSKVRTMASIMKALSTQDSAYKFYNVTAPTTDLSILYHPTLPDSAKVLYFHMCTLGMYVNASVKELSIDLGRSLEQVESDLQVLIKACYVYDENYQCLTVMSGMECISLSIEEAAKFLGVDAQKVSKFIARNLLPLDDEGNILMRSLFMIKRFTIVRREQLKNKYEFDYYKCTTVSI